MDEHKHTPLDLSKTSAGRSSKFDRSRPLALMVMFDDNDRVCAEVRVCASCSAMYYVMLNEEAPKRYMKESAGYAS